MAARIFVQPGATVRYLAQEPDMSGYATTRDYVEAGLNPHEDPNRAFYLLGNLGLSGDENPATPFGRRGAPRRAGPRAGAAARYPAAGRAHQPSGRHAIEWLEGEIKSSRCALVLISHDRRFLENLSSRLNSTTVSRATVGAPAAGSRSRPACAGG